MNIEPVFAQALVQSMHPLMHKWLPQNVLLDSAFKYVKTQVTDESQLAERVKARPYKNAKPEDYLTRLHTLSDGTRALVAISFAHDNTRFVHISAFDRPLSANIFDELANFALEAFAVFEPDRVSVFRFSSESEIVTKTFAVERNYRMLAAPLAHLKSQPRFANHNRLKLVTLNNLSFYEWYLDVYEKFYATHPHLKEHVPTEDRESFQKIIDAQSCFEIQIDGVRAGLISAKRMEWLGLSGYMVSEIVLTQDHLGKGWSPIAQHHFCDCLVDTGNDALIGTIHYDNIRSLKMALRSGRTDLGGRFWLTRHS